MHTEAHLFSVPNDCLWYDKLWGPSQRVVTLLLLYKTEVYCQNNCYSHIKLKCIVKINVTLIKKTEEYCQNN